jgi:hypothetical protein
MKLRRVSPADALELVQELRGMVALSPGPNPELLKRAREIRFQLCGQPWARDHLVEKADAVIRDLEILFSPRRWKDLGPDLEGFRKTIKSACDRLAAHVPVDGPERAV